MASNFPTPYVNNNPRPKVDTGPGKTKQSFKDECDINQIMKRYARTGTLPQGVGIARYGDFSQAEDYLEAQVTIKRAEEQFRALPSKVRERFDNQPSKLLAFIQDKANLKEAHELGLLNEEVIIPQEKPASPPTVP